MSDEAVCCPLSGDDYADSPEFFNQEVVTGKKDYRCYECREPISKGTRHERTTGKWDGRVETLRSCLSCVEIRDHFSCGNSYSFGELWEQLGEYFFPDMKAGGPCMTGLSPEAKGRLFERRLQWLEDTSG